VRALSLLAILLFHSHLRWAPGGFLGVTVFFTLSGFLITSLLLTERATTGGIDLRAFWVRRARRLAPAVLVLLALVALLVATGELTARRTLAGDAAATAGWVANWRFLLSGQSYGDLFSQPSPFQHMWSLAVEEQFYLLFPGLLLLLLGRSERLRRGRAALVVLTGVGLSTFACSAFAHPGAVERSYYGTDTRMAEPFVGVLLALALTRAGQVRALPRAARLLLDVAAAAALVALAVLVHRLGQYSATLYHGRLLLVAVLSAVLLAGVTQPGSLLGRVLGMRPLVLLGRISYGGYVFHWPVFLWLSAERTGIEGWRLLALRAAATLLLAAASYLLVEQPVRRSTRLRMAFAVPAWANATVLALAALVLASGAVTVPSPPTTRDDLALGAGPATTALTTSAAVAGGRSTPRAVSRAATARQTPMVSATLGASPSASGSPSAGPSVTVPGAKGAVHKPSIKPIRIAVVGDSLALNLGGGLSSWANTLGNVAVDNLSLSGCPIARGGMRRWPDGYEVPVRAECSWWADPNSKQMKQLNGFDPQVVVIQDGMNELVERKLDTWSSYRRAGDPTFDSWLLGEYRLALPALNPSGKRTILFLNAVCADWNRVAHFQGFGPELSSRVTSLNLDYDRLHSQTGVTMDDLDGHLCPNGQYSDTVDGVSDARPDGYHLSKDAALAVAKSWLGPLCLDATKPS